MSDIFAAFNAILVVLIAIVFDYKVLDPQYIWATGGVVLALGITYWLLLRRDREGEATQT